MFYNLNGCCRFRISITSFKCLASSVCLLVCKIIIKAVQMDLFPDFKIRDAAIQRNSCSFYAETPGLLRKMFSTSHRVSPVHILSLMNSG